MFQRLLTSTKPGFYKTPPVTMMKLFRVTQSAAATCCVLIPMAKTSHFSAAFAFPCFHPRVFLSSIILHKVHARTALNTLSNKFHKDAIIANTAQPISPPHGDTESAALTLIGYKGGKLEEQINQDRAFVLDPFTIAAQHRHSKRNVMRLVGVFDGHSEQGEVVSQYALDELPRLLSHKLSSIFSQFKNDESGEEEEAVRLALTQTFLEIDETISYPHKGGCTASLLLQIGSKVYSANAGDSRSFLISYCTKTKRTNIIHASIENKPDVPSERARVERMGGRISIPPPHDGDTARVLYYDAQTGYETGLAMSRSIGDWEFKPIGVVADPIVEVVDLTRLLVLTSIDENDNVCRAVGTDKSVCAIESAVNPQEPPPPPPPLLKEVSEGQVFVFAVSATDGLLDFVSPDKIAQVLAQSLYQHHHILLEHSNDNDNNVHLLTACEDLILEAAKGWYEEMGHSYRDDISIAVMKITMS